MKRRVGWGCPIPTRTSPDPASRRSTIPILASQSSGLERLPALSLAELPNLTDAALSDLTTIGESGAAFVELPALITLDLPALTTIEGGLLLRDTALQDLSGLSALTSIGGDLQITDNPDLDQQEIDAFLAHVTVAGRVTVE